MNFATQNADLRQFFGALILCAALALTAWAYRPGLSGSIHFDDTPSLGELPAIADTPSAIRFISEGVAGPLGRPLALASFVPQAYAWPHTPDVFLYVNICLHLLNGVLVIWMLYLLSIARARTSEQAVWIASISGAIWMLSPLLASSSLLIVQRMTTLSATFLLLGFVAYLYSRSLLDKRPRLAFLLMTVSLVLGTSLAALAKENGALLPVFVLVAEATLLDRPANNDVRRWWKAWAAIFLVGPAIVLLTYLLLHLRYAESVVLMRDFTAADRLLTQAHVLWQYLYHSVVPVTSQLGPFHDDQPVYRDWLEPLSMLAVAAWLAVLGCTAWLRRRAPLFCFAIGWYVVGHALESTTIPLELYFEHRNYLPLIGPIFALVASLSAARWPQRYVRAGLLAYICMLAVVLFNTTSLWGQPALASEMWAIQHPDSSRATQYLALQYQRMGDDQTVRRVLRRRLEKDPQSAGVRLQVLALSCLMEPNKSHQELVETVEAHLRLPRFESGVFDILRGLYRMAENERCDTVNRGAIYRLAALAAENPAFQAVPAEHHNLHVLMSEEAFAQRDLDLTMHHIEAALSAHYTLTTVILAVRMLSSAGLYSAAETFVQDAGTRVPWHPLRATIWRQQIMDLQKAIRVASHE